MRFFIRILVGSLIAAGLSTVAMSASAPSDLAQQIQNPSLDVSHAVELKDFSILMGGGVLEIDQGVLLPANPISGKVMEAVFLGKALFHLAPVNEVEAQQLEVFTRQTNVGAAVDQAVFAAGNTSLMNSLLDRPAAKLDPAQQAQAQEFFKGWVQGPERRGFGAAAAIWRIVAADPLYGEYLAVMFHSPDLGKFCLVLDPSETEQLLVGRFVPREMDDREKREREHDLQMAQKEGRALQSRLEDLGFWDTWTKTSLRDESGPRPGSDNFEPTHYDIEAKLDPKALTLEGKTTLHLTAQQEGARTVDLTLFSDLTPSAIRDGSGRDLSWYRSGGDLVVALGDPVHKNEQITLEVAYAGVIFRELADEAAALLDTHGWFPHAGTIDRATYKLVLRWPKKYGLVGSGQLVESHMENKDQVDTRALEFPATNVSLEIGKFDLVEQQVGHIKISAYFNRGFGTISKDVEQEVMDTLKGALPFYEEKFGPYPLDTLTVATIPRGFSQGYLGFLTLANDMLLVSSPLDPGKGMENFVSRERMETVAHELAHQWWGNLVGWKSYRDQWLSEALASYSAMLYLKSEAKRQSVYLAEHSQDWKSSLRQTTLDGRSLESLGPVVIGNRLYSSLSDRAYQAIVYDKGSLVFNMLAQAVGEDRLSLMLNYLVKALNNKPIDTETFLASLEKMGQVNLSTFSKQFVYGTGIPEIYYNFQFQQSADGKWTVQGEARETVVPHYHYEAVHKGSGWDITRARKETTQMAGWTLLVPFQVILDEGGAAGDKVKKGDYQTGRGLGGTLKVSGQSTPFNFKIDKKPRDFWLDQRGQVLAYFFCGSREPKRALRYMAAQGPQDQAEGTYKKALAAELLAGQTLTETKASAQELKTQSRLEDARIYFGLARLYLDLGRYADSYQALTTGEDLIRAHEGKFWEDERDALHSRHNLLRGEFKETYKRLYGDLQMYFPVKNGEHASDVWRRSQWSTGRLGDAEDYAMLAVAAFETAHNEVAQLATKYAEERGADMTALKQLLVVSKDE